MPSTTATTAAVGSRTHQLTFSETRRPLLQAAAGWLVENDVAAEEAAWREELLEEAEAEARGERERQKSKAAILERWVTVPCGRAAD